MNRQTKDNCQRPRKTGRRCRLPCSGKNKTAQLLSDRSGLPLCSRNLKESNGSAHCLMGRAFGEQWEFFLLLPIFLFFRGECQWL